MIKITHSTPEDRLRFILPVLKQLRILNIEEKINEDVTEVTFNIPILLEKSFVKE